MCLQSNLREWHGIGASSTVIDWIKHGVGLPFKCSPPPQNIHCVNRKLNENQVAFVDSEVQNLLHNNVIEKCEYPYFVSPINAVPKKGKNKWRLIVDLRQLNQYIDPPKFTNEGVKEVQDLIESNDNIITVDLKYGFYHIPLASEFRKYVCFQWRGVCYQWRKICFGLNVSPYYFAKIIRPVLSYLRSQGLRLSVFVDDWILLSSPKSIECHKNMLLETLDQVVPRPGNFQYLDRLCHIVNNVPRQTRNKNSTGQDYQVTQRYSQIAGSWTITSQGAGAYRGTVCSDGSSNFAREVTSTQRVSRIGNQSVMGRAGSFVARGNKGTQMVTGSVAQLESTFDRKTRYRSTNNDGCVVNRMGSMAESVQSSWFLEPKFREYALQLQ